MLCEAPLSVFHKKGFKDRCYNMITAQLIELTKLLSGGTSEIGIDLKYGIILVL